MIVVADSGPLHYLILIEQAELLRTFYGRVVLPAAVLKELSSPSTPPAVKRWLEPLPEWVTVEMVASHQLEMVTDQLDPGEREAIALAESLRADLLLMDESSGRAEARRRNLRVTGTLGVLRTAAERELIHVPSVLMALRTTSFYVDEELINSIFHPWLERSC